MIDPIRFGLGSLLGRVRMHTRPMSLGVRGALFDPQGRIFLIRHTYMPGWYMPGGGVDPGETAAEAMARELREEGNIVLLEPPRLVSVHFNRPKLQRDHVLFYVCGAFRQDGAKQPDMEIADTGFFSLDALPEETTKATRRRIAELVEGVAADPDW